MFTRKQQDVDRRDELEPCLAEPSLWKAGRRPGYVPGYDRTGQHAAGPTVGSRVALDQYKSVSPVGLREAKPVEAISLGKDGWTWR